MNDPVARRTVSTIIVYALGRWQTAAIVLGTCFGIAITLILFGVNWRFIAAWIFLGMLGITGMVVLTLRDSRSYRDATAPVIDPSQLKTPQLRQSVERAITYRDAIRDTVDAIAAPDLRSSMVSLTDRFDSPPAVIFSLGKQVEAIRGDHIIAADLARLRAQQRSKSLNDAQRNQLSQLERLEALATDGFETIESTLALLGASYAEIRAIGAINAIGSASVQSALADLRERTLHLGEVSQALEDIRDHR